MSTYAVTVRAFRLAAVVCAFGVCTAFAGQAWSAVDARSAARLQSIESAIQSAGFSRTGQSAVVRGIVTSNRRRIVIEDRTGAIELKLDDLNQQISLGDEVEVSGPLVFSPAPQIQHAQMRRLWGGSMPLPLSITPDQAADGDNEFFLVETVAKLADFTPAGLTGVRLNLRGGHQNFSAVLPSNGRDEDLSVRSLAPGATLRLTGILVVNHLSGAEAFSLELRGPDDLELVEPPSWWTGTHIALLAGMACILVLSVLSWLNYVRHARFRAVAEERASIARDLHDTLAQGYAGVTLQLEAAQQMISRDPLRAESLLKEALQLVRHSRHESHVSIDILRSLSRDQRLDELIARCVSQLSAGSEAHIHMQVSGEPAVLSYTMVNNLFRIAQEALSNSVHHSRAREIIVRVQYRERSVAVEVSDDGAGFDPTHVPGPEEGHFGLAGIRERCAAIGGQLQVESSPGRTMVRVKAGTA